MEENNTTTTESINTQAEAQVNPAIITGAPDGEQKPPIRQGMKAYIATSAIVIIGTLATFILGWLILAQKAKQGVSGTEFIFLLLIPFFLLAVIMSIANVFVIPRALSRHSFTSGWKKMAKIVFRVSAVVVAIGLAVIVLNIIALVKLRIDDAAQNKLLAKQVAEDRITMVPKEQTVAEATTLLKECKIFGFYYPGEVKSENYVQYLDSDTLAAEHASTGIITVKLPRTNQYRLHVAVREQMNLVPVARSVQQKCNGPQFWHDGSYEVK